MAMGQIGFTTELKGFHELERKLKALPAKVEKKVTRKALTKGGNVILRKTRENAKTMVGGEMGRLIAKHLKSRAMVKMKKGFVGRKIIIDAAGNEQFVETSAEGNRNYIPNAIEFGHGNAAPIPFQRNAYESTKQKSLQVITGEYKRGIETEAKKIP